MKIIAILIFLFTLSVSVAGQVTTSNARRTPTGSGAPSGSCISGPPFGSDYTDTSTTPPTIYKCKAGSWAATAGGGTNAPTNATYITQTPNTTLSAEQALSTLASGLLKNHTGDGVLSIAAAGADYVAPGGALGTPSSGVATNLTGLPEGGLSLTDITTNNFSITKHGFVPKGTNVGSFLRDDGTWAAGGLPSGLTFVSPDFTVATAAANHAVLSGSPTGTPIKLVATGSDPVVGIQLLPKGGDTQEAAVYIGEISDDTTLNSYCRLIISSDGNNDGVVGVVNVSAGSSTPFYMLWKSRGTLAAPQETQDGDFLGEMEAGGYSNVGGFGTAGKISIIQEGAVGVDKFHIGARLQFTMNQTSGVSVEPLILRATGVEVPLLNASQVVFTDASKNLVSVATTGAGSVVLSSTTITPGGTTGAQTINKTAGAVNFAAAATSLVVTNSLVSTSSVIICTVGTNDTTLKAVQCVAGAGNFTMFASAAATAETRVNFFVVN